MTCTPRTSGFAERGVRLEGGTARLRLAITVSYDLNGHTAADMERQLRYAADRLTGGGLLSGESGAEVTEWDANVEELR